MPYMIAEPKHISRPSVYGGGDLITEWIPKECYGVFEKIVDAKLAYLRSMKELSSEKQYSDEFITRFFKPYQTNMKMVKIVKV